MVARNALVQIWKSGHGTHRTVQTRRVLVPKKVASRHGSQIQSWLVPEWVLDWLSALAGGTRK